MREELLQVLQSEFNLTKKDTTIISELVKNKMTAENLCSLTKIPKGKIYTFLNKLLELKLIEKSSDFPATYSVPNLEQKMLDFLNEEFGQFTKKQKRLTDLLREENTDLGDFEIIYDKREFIFKLMEMLSTGKEFKYILRYPALPYLTYLAPTKEFQEIHNLIAKSRDALTDSKDNAPILLNNLYTKKFKEGSRFEFVVCKQALDEFLKLIENKKGKLAYKKKISEIKSKIKKYDASMKVVDEHFPLGVYLSKNKVIIVLNSSGALTGIVHQKKEVVDFYNNLFYEMQERAYPAEDYFNQINRSKKK